MSKLQETFRKNVLMQLGDKPQSWLSKHSGIAQGSLFSALSVDGNPTLKTVEAVGDAFKIAPAVLLGGADGKAYDVPKDILELLEGRDKAVYDAIRVILKNLVGNQPKRKSN